MAGRRPPQELLVMGLLGSDSNQVIFWASGTSQIGYLLLVTKHQRKAIRLSSRTGPSIDTVGRVWRTRQRRGQSLQEFSWSYGLRADTDEITRWEGKRPSFAQC